MYKTTSVEDQQKFIVPMNKDSENIWYDQRFIIDNKVKNPRCWRVSKLNRLQSNGICLVTTAQDIFDPNRDYIERDEYGKIIGMWCEWFRQNQYAVDPQPVIPPSTLPDYYIKLIFGGTKPVLKVRGNYKKITATFLDKHENVVDDTFVDEWKVEIDGTNVSEITDGEVSVVTHDDDDTLTANQIKIKTASDSLLGKVVSVTAIKGGLTDTKNFEIVGM